MEKLNIKQAFRESNICRQLENDFRHARARIQEQHDQAERLIEKIKIENELLEDFRRQRQRAGDDGFDADIAQQESNINIIRRKVQRAREIAHRWEGEADMLERQLIANDCGSFA